uniref:Uncharacterized protein n=1 Tax=Anopheles atroparvus TaxID=41427 RepID=A0A182J9Y4_ANOAO
MVGAPSGYGNELVNSTSAPMYDWAICNVSCLENWRSLPSEGRYWRNRSKASFRPFIRFRSRALAARRRFFRTTVGTAPPRLPLLLVTGTTPTFTRAMSQSGKGEQLPLLLLASSDVKLPGECKRASPHAPLPAVDGGLGGKMSPVALGLHSSLLASTGGKDHVPVKKPSRFACPNGSVESSWNCCCCSCWGCWYPYFDVVQQVRRVEANSPVSPEKEDHHRRNRQGCTN